MLAEDIHAPIDVPAFSNSAMDGYALHDQDIQGGDKERASPLPVHGEAAAGSSPKELRRGSAMRIFTGAAIPRGATLVIPQEHCDYNVEANTISIHLPAPSAGTHIRPARQNYAKGDLVCSAGTVLTERHIPLLVSLGLTRCRVKKQLRVAICVSGDELQDVGSALKLGEIYDSNSVYLSMSCKKLDCRVVMCEHIADDYQKTQEVLARAAREADLIITSGGISVGDKDYVRDVIFADGQVLIHSVSIKPGKPFTLARLHNTLLTALPGNPLSVFVTFLWFVMPYIRRVQGVDYQHALVRMTSPEHYPAYPRTRFLFAMVNMHQGYEIALVPDQSSAALKNMVLANAALIIPANTEVAKGDALQVFLIP